MNLQQFAKLKEGDKVMHELTDSVGHVVKATREGVEIAWGGNPRTFHFTATSTAWFHWRRLDPSIPDARPVDHGSGGHV